MLITIDEACYHLRIDGEHEDQWLNTMIPAVSDAVLLWLKDADRAYQPKVDANGGVVVGAGGEPVMVARPVVKMAALVELAYQYRFREGDGPRLDAALGYTLCAGATALLAPLRRSTVA